MREIEFRWKTPFGWQYWSTEKDYSLWLWSNRETLCQYIGLKDKNGVKIYEGDVLKFSWLRGFTVVESLQVVRFCKDVAAFKFWDGTSWCPFWGFSSDDMEVVGNIFDDLEFEKKFGEIYRSKE